MSNKVSKIETRNKSLHFKEVLGFLPFCKKAVTMTGLTAIDVRHLSGAGKFGVNTFITNYETMDKHWTKDVSTPSEFIEKWNGLLKNLLNSESDKRKTLFKDIFKSSLIDDAGDENDLVLADACCPYRTDIARWAGSDTTLNAIAVDGIIGINTNLLRCSLKGDSSSFEHGGVKHIMKGSYCNDEEKYDMIWRMHIIANDVEEASNKRLTTVLMLNYWDDPRSKMGYIFLEKLDEQLDKLKNRSIAGICFFINDTNTKELNNDRHNDRHNANRIRS